MRIDTVRIKNYRSIEDITFNTEQLDDGSFTYGLVGVNEAGKSTILKALALKDGLKNQIGETLPLQKDFRDKTLPITIEYTCFLNSKDIKEIQDYLAKIPDLGDTATINFTPLIFTITFDHGSPSTIVLSVEIPGIEKGNVHKQTIQEHLKTIVDKKAPKSIFWTAEDRYLISLPINLAQFAATPDEVSVPLQNCFALAGIIGKEAINSRLAQIGESTEREQLKNELGEKVTEHINEAWPKHPIKITFDISDGLIYFHIHDNNLKSRAKTADQRSDGFRQFISFLLTISAQNKNGELSNTVLLLDEPETHLHPQAQENLLRELVKITQSKKGNIAFFATHSNYMIDKDNLSRNYRVTKILNSAKGKEITELQRFDKKTSTYSSVTYEVFDILSTDYHNELYSKVHERYQAEDGADEKREGIRNFDTGFLKNTKELTQDRPYRAENNKATLPTYIRNCIHHPDNGDKYSQEDLRKSIELLRTFLL